MGVVPLRPEGENIFSAPGSKGPSRFWLWAPRRTHPVCFPYMQDPRFLATKTALTGGPVAGLDDACLATTG